LREQLNAPIAVTPKRALLAFSVSKADDIEASTVTQNNRLDVSLRKIRASIEIGVHWFGSVSSSKRD